MLTVGFVFDPSCELFQVVRLISRQNAVRAAVSLMCRRFAISFHSYPQLRRPNIFRPLSLRPQPSFSRSSRGLTRVAQLGSEHAGVIVLLSLICQLLADGPALPPSSLWIARVGVPLAAILIPAGFIFSKLSRSATRPNGFISLIHPGAAVLAASVVTLGAGLLRAALLVRSAHSAAPKQWLLILKRQLMLAKPTILRQFGPVTGHSTSFTRS